MKKLQWVLIISVFVFVNILFNFSLWNEFFGTKVMVSDNVMIEHLVETSYRNILHFKNPFITKSILYPFTINFSMNDSGIVYTLAFFFLRPFIDPHKSFTVIIIFEFFLNNFFMYLLLIKLNIRQVISTLVALIFGFTPFLSHRVTGHYTYIPIFFFPLIFLVFKKILETAKNREKYIFSFLLGLLMAIILLSNFYYFFMIVLGIIFYIGYWLLVDRKFFLILIKKNIISFSLSVITTVFLLTPWIITVYKLIKTEGLVETPGYGGANLLSSDIASFFTPSEYNPIYKIFFSRIASIIPLFSRYNHFYLNNWGSFSYPGVFIVIFYLSIIFLKFFVNKFPRILWNRISQHFFVSLIFAVLMLGPFLKMFNRWFINLDGVLLTIPLPFLVIHYIPGLSAIRASSRFTPIFVFLACIVLAYTIEYWIKKINKKRALFLIVCLFLVFFIDQFYMIPTNSGLYQENPTKISNYLKNRPHGTVLEIPFTVRDGFQYLGFVHAIQPMARQLIHGKPIIGGYMPRINQSIFDYYKNLKFIGYIVKIIDKGNYNPLAEKPKEIIMYPYPYPDNTIKQELNSLNIKYIILKTDEKYSNYLLSLLKKIGFSEKMRDSNYLLLEQ